MDPGRPYPTCGSGANSSSTAISRPSKGGNTGGINLAGTETRPYALAGDSSYTVQARGAGRLVQRASATSARIHSRSQSVRNMPAQP